jgi:hypothetical protein
MATIPPWKIQADYLESCNCEFGCPCNFSGWPTGGRCEALVAYHIRNGSYGAVQLDGLDFVYGASWPRAIHEDGGTMRVYIDERGLAEQRAALPEIPTGARAAPDASRSSPRRCATSSTRNSCRFRSVDGKRGSFSVPDVLEVQLRERKGGGESRLELWQRPLGTDQPVGQLTRRSARQRESSPTRVPTSARGLGADHRREPRLSFAKNRQ